MLYDYVEAGPEVVSSGVEVREACYAEG